MPKSKRARVVHLSKVEKKTKQDLEVLQSNVEAAAQEYKYGYVVVVDNMRNNHLKEVRTTLAADSRIFFGRNRIMARAMGTTPANEVQPGLHTLSGHLTGQTGLIFSSRTPDELLGALADLSSGAYARTGTVASRDFVIPAGVVYSRAGEVPVQDDVKVTAMQEVHLRAQGLPTRMEKGNVVIDEDYTVCKKGETISGGQSSVLKFFGVEVAEFRVRVKAYWSSESEETTILDDSEQRDEDTDME